MAEIVLDASALIALIKLEPGFDLVLSHLQESDCVMSSVNWAEVLCKVGADTVLARFEANGIEDDVIAFAPFGPREAEELAKFPAQAGGVALSLGDRACLSLARRLAAPALTADRIWREVYPDTLLIRP